MNWYETMFNYLTEQPKARERSNKNRAIGNLLVKKYGKRVGKDGTTNPNQPFLHNEFKLSREVMGELVGETLTADRAWRKVLEECPDLRGSDYKDKNDLEYQKQLELGYDI